jgi:hypothetical protein
LISALSASRKIKSPGIVRGSFVVQARKELLSAGDSAARAPGLAGRKRFALGREPLQYGTLLEHDPEKWVPVFRKGHAQTKKDGADDGSKRRHRAP